MRRNGGAIQPVDASNEVDVANSLRFPREKRLGPRRSSGHLPPVPIPMGPIHAILAVFGSTPAETTGLYTLSPLPLLRRIYGKCGVSSWKVRSVEK